MKTRVEFPDWRTDAVAVICDSQTHCEWYLFSYKTPICRIKYTTKTDETRITFNDKPYRASVTTSKHLRWFLEKYLSKYEQVELMQAANAKSMKDLMLSNIDYVFQYNA